MIEILNNRKNAIEYKVYKALQGIESMEYSCSYELYDLLQDILIDVNLLDMCINSVTHEDIERRV